MDRRRFLAAGAAAAVSPTLAAADAPGAVAAASPAARVDFTTDGLALTPREYAAQLHDIAQATDVEPDYYSNGGAIAALERRFASLLGKEAALFLPTGTLANHLAVRRLAGRDRRVLVQAESHLYNDSGDGATTLSGLTLVPLAAGRATIALDEVRQWVERTAGGRVAAKAGVLSIENPVRRRDHERVDPDELARVCEYARSQDIRLHLDGARLFTLPLHSGQSVRDHAAPFDTVYVSLWKHFNAAAGAILAGDAPFIEGLFHERRMFGGSLPQAWPEVLVVERYLDGFEASYAQAWRAADGMIGLLEASGRFTARKLDNGTSRFFLSVPPAAAAAFAERAGAQGVVVASPKPGSTELPMQVNASILRRSPESIARVLIDAATTA
jgi:threonine aldolase